MRRTSRSKVRGVLNFKRHVKSVVHKRSFNTKWDETIITLRQESYKQLFFVGKYLRHLQEVRAAQVSRPVVFTGHISKRRTLRYLEQKMREWHSSSREEQNERGVPFSGRTKANARMVRSAVSCGPQKRPKDNREPLWLKPFWLKHFLFFGFLRCWPSIYFPFWTVRENGRTSDNGHDDAVSQGRTPNGYGLCAVA